LVVVALAACVPSPEDRKPGLRLEAVTFDALPGWREDDSAEALVAFRRSCARLVKQDDGRRTVAGTLVLRGSDWKEPCAAADTLTDGGADSARSFFETWFRPYAARGPDGDEGLFTGYFEMEINGARAPGEGFRTPLYRLPRDQVTVNLGAFDPALVGRRLVGRVDGGKLVPYHTRGEIQNGALNGRALEMLWLENPVDLYMLHIQGSGRVRLADGSVLRVGFAGHNGHDYASIGRELIRRGEMKRGAVTWPAIHDWVVRNPDKASELFAANPRYIFFRIINGLPVDAGPPGAQGVPLTAGRSLAVDARHVPLGLPVWLDSVWPNKPERPLRRLMVAQDTGGAIKGEVRGDFFWGTGAAALAQAGKMKSRGRYFLLLPRTTAARRAGS
jgi:membrane-bound lytic murein transglycosylase A